MYEKWKKYTEEHPYKSILLVSIGASLLGITAEYIINRDFLSGGFWVTLILVTGQILIVNKTNK